MTDVDILHESEEGADELINALVEAEAPVLLLHNLSRLDEQVPDERDAVHNTLGTQILPTTSNYALYFLKTILSNPSH